MKTLFIYYCTDSRIGKICAENADSKYTDVIELSPRYSCGYGKKTVMRFKRTGCQN